MEDVRIYAITDSHQECRNLCALFSKITKFEQNSRNDFLLLDCGDIFKGIYDKDLCVEMYLKFKSLNPNAHIALTIGNNDFGFVANDFEYFKSAITRFKNNGIDFVCCNMKQISNGEYASLVPRYKIVELNGTKFLITGFCLNTSIIKNFGYEFENANIALLNLLEKVNDAYDKLIILNHHWYNYSKELYEFAKNNNINIDLIIGGHEHSPISPDYERNIYYPLSFARSLYRIDFCNNVENSVEIGVDDSELLPDFEEDLSRYEQETELYKPVAKRVLNLYKWYSEPCALGTFISDNMKRVANTDIAFHSTGFTMFSLKTSDSDVITKYDFEKVICASTPIVKVALNIAQLKRIFENATLRRMYKNNGNARFLQCSQNICIRGKGNPEDKTYKIIQIEINGEKLLDEFQNPIDDRKIYTCAIDEFISKGEQGFELLKFLDKEYVEYENKQVHLNELLLDSLKKAQNLYPPNTQYPVFKLIDL